MKKLLSLSLTILLFSCGQDDNICLYEPIVTTDAVIDIGENSAILNGKIVVTSENCDVPSNTIQGFIYSKENLPTINNSEIIVVNDNNNQITTSYLYEEPITGLEPNTTYYIRSILTNTFGEFYGNVVSFTTLDEQNEIGDFAYGGIIFWINPNDNSKGLVCAVSDQSSDIDWNNIGYTITGASGLTIGTGNSNTDSIIAEQGATETNYAAGLARAYNGGGYNDWFLPSRDELNQIYQNRLSIDDVALDNGGDSFNYYWYWSSSEYSSSGAWALRFGNGSIDFKSKDLPFYVRAVRAF